MCLGGAAHIDQQKTAEDEHHAADGGESHVLAQEEGTQKECEDEIEADGDGHNGRHRGQSQRPEHGHSGAQKHYAPDDDERPNREQDVGKEPFEGVAADLVLEERYSTDVQNRRQAAQNDHKEKTHWDQPYPCFGWTRSFILFKSPFCSQLTRSLLGQPLLYEVVVWREGHADLS